MKKVFFIIIVFLSFGCRILVAQYDAQLSNYWAAPTYYNPATAGQYDDLEAMLLNRMQWVGFEGNPKTMMISANLPFKLLGRVHGGGLMLLSESAGLFSHSITAGQYAYKTDFKKGKLSVGIQVGNMKDSFDGAGVNIKDMKDPYHEGIGDSIPTAKMDGSAIDFNFGIYYSRKNWYGGLSVTHLTAPKVALGENYERDLPRGYYLMGGYNILLNNPLLELQTSLLVKSTVMMTQGDITARMIYNKLFYAGLSWRYGYAEIGNSESVILMLGGSYKSFRAGYAYDYPTSAIRIGTTGSHELFVKYIIDLNSGKKGKNKHKSVRIL